MGKPLSVGELDIHLTQCGLCQAYLHAKWYPNSSNRLATIHQRHRQTGQDRTDRQRSNRIGRTVLQMFDQKYFSSLDFVVNRFFMKLFRTNSIDIVKQCQYHFGFRLPSDFWDKRVQKFDAKFYARSNLLCKKMFGRPIYLVYFCVFVL